MTHVVKAAGAADLLAMVPMLVGFEPRNSLVFVAFRGNRTCGALRVDLPAPEQSHVHRRLASHVVGTLCRINGAESVVFVVYTDELFDGTSSRPRAELARLFEKRLLQTGFEIRDSLCVAADGWAAYADRNVPLGGHPLSAIIESPVVASVPQELQRASALPTGQPRVPDAAPATKRRVAADLARYRLALSDGDSEGVTAQLAPLLDLPGLAEEALQWDRAAIDAHGALLLLALQGPSVRDTVMLQWATSFTVGLHVWDEVQHQVGSDSHDDLADLMLGIGPKPDRDRVEASIALLRDLVSRAPDAERPAPLCMLAWLNWALGRGSVAGEYVDEARSIDPDYSMAQLLEAMLGSGILPDWVF